MKQSGRISLLTLGVVAMVGMLIAALFLATESPKNAGATFMDALSRQDVDKLVEYSYTGKTDPTEIENEKKALKEKWDFAVNTAGKYYAFVWRVTGSTNASETEASVSMQLAKNAMNPSSYEEKFELPMVKENGKWKVDVYGISRDMFPGLPRK